MPMIPTIVKREDDELLYSWMLRISDANGFSVVRSFWNAYITPNATASEKSKRVLKYSLLEDYEKVYRAPNLSIDKMDLFLQTGIFPYCSLFMTSEQQSSVIDTAFDNNANDNAAAVTYKKLISSLKLCPECMKEDIGRIGRFYYHRRHQLPGVTVCWKHGCALHVYKGVPMHEMYADPQTTALEADKNAVGFAKFSSALLDADLDMGEAAFKRIVTRKISQMYAGDQDSFHKALVDTYLEYRDNSSFRKLWRSLHDSGYIEPDIGARLLMFLYKDVDALKAEISRPEAPDEFQHALAGKKCTLVSGYRSSIVELKHACGFEFVINPDEFIHNWVCPACEKESASVFRTDVRPVALRTEESFRQEICDLVGDEYELVSSYAGMKQKVLIRHNACGCSQYYFPSTFLDGGRCKHCNTFLKDEQFKELVANLSNGRYAVTARRTYNLYTITDQKTKISRDMSRKKILQELRRPTPSILLPMDSKGKETNTLSKIDFVWNWIQEHCPHGTPIFLEDLTADGMSYQTNEICTRNLRLDKHLIKLICLGVYEYADDNLDDDTVVKARYLYRNGHHIGYPTGSNALYYFGIITEKPDEYRLVTNKETSSNHTGRTTTFLGHKLRIHGSPIEVTDDNWQTLMVLDTVCNLGKYLNGADQTEALRILRAYIAANHITHEALSWYQKNTGHAYNAVRKLYEVEDA